jgi:hypothetical protein
MAVSADQRRALKLLASSPDGCPMAIMARGFKNVMLNGRARRARDDNAREMIKEGRLAGVRRPVLIRKKLHISGREPARAELFANLKAHL